MEKIFPVNIIRLPDNTAGLVLPTELSGLSEDERVKRVKAVLESAKATIEQVLSNLGSANCSYAKSF
ncbi:hypothetical protein A3B18_01010 [Candidatus Giovannonibacteria bacterium RIFCSPLOWO2_01_FULL_46_13]|uniref:Uncharacterized protein n=1 Tax=Candidatus Giovannonibacteria bacterium RIFCSPLOWO2_01_FULL_46_13 TaxID=1798352 RepID=A0A1F5X2T9_9BACT|nr:MAG: hypothetical protein A3B18_01010 [Candidatus Giovannonibacteria bacterium RIFCSPLOWO2_01_FULL_46_13]